MAVTDGLRNDGYRKASEWQLQIGLRMAVTERLAIVTAITGGLVNVGYTACRVVSLHTHREMG